MTLLAEPTDQVRPPEPRTARSVLAPFAAYVVALGVFGYLGEIGPVWGFFIGAATFGLFYWIRLTRSLLDGAVLAVTGTVAFSLFSLVLVGRDGGITNGLALQAALTIAILGVAAGWVTYRNSPGLKVSTIGLSAATWGGGAYLALLTAVAMGFLDRIREGEVQALTFGLFIAVGISASAWLAPRAMCRSGSATPCRSPSALVG